MIIQSVLTKDYNDLKERIVGLGEYSKNIIYDAVGNMNNILVLNAGLKESGDGYLSEDVELLEYDILQEVMTALNTESSENIEKYLQGKGTDSTDGNILLLKQFATDSFWGNIPK